MEENTRIFIDFGSSTIKVYKKTNSSLDLYLAKSGHFKKDFSPEKGLSKQNRQIVYDLVNKIKEDNPHAQIKTYATALYRKMTPKAKNSFFKEFFEKTGVEFNIISHDKESLYLKEALIGKYKGNEPVLLINIGGGSTELVVVQSGEEIEKHNINVGVGTIISKFEGINDKYSNYSMETVVKHVATNLPNPKNKVNIAFISGGELNYMRLAKYNLDKNNLFDDEKHPGILDIRSFKERNSEIFSEVTIENLKSLMPENPKWMYGARASIALSQAICEKFGVQMIIPSDSNLIDGVVSHFSSE